MTSNSIARLALYLALSSGLALTVWGLWQQAWPDVLPWAGVEAIQHYATFLFVMTLLVALGAMWVRKAPIIVGSVLAGVVALSAGALWPLLVVVWFVLASAILGQSALAVLRIQKSSADLITSFLVGAGIYGTAAGLLAHFPANYPGVYGAALAAPLILGRRTLLQMYPAARTWFLDKTPCSVSEWWLGLAIAVVGLVHFTVALMPELGHDALAVHLFVSAHMTLRHQWGFDPGLYVWAVMPMLGDWLFSVAYMLGGETCARLFNVGFLYVLAILGRELVHWAGGDGKAAKWAVLIFLSTPLAFTESNSLYIDTVWAAYIVAGIGWFLRFVLSLQEENSHGLKMACLMLGFAAAAKFGTITVIPVLLVVSLYRWRLASLIRFVRPFGLGLVMFVAVGAIPYLTAWVATGNPVFPFFNGVFQSPFYPAVNFDMPLYKSGVSWDLLYRVTFNSGKYLEATNGAAGFQWLLLFLPALIVLSIKRNIQGTMLSVIGALLVVATFPAQSYLRYVFPSFLLLSVTIGMSLSQSTTIWDRTGRWFSLVAAITVGLNLLFLSAGTWVYRDVPYNILLSEASRSDYLNSRAPIRQATGIVNSINSARTPVAVFSLPLVAGLNANALIPNWYNFRFQQAINTAVDAQGIVNALSDYEAEYVLLDATWGMAEKRKLIEEATGKIADFGSISVRSIKKEFRHSVELLKNSMLAGTEYWQLNLGATYDAQNEALLVSATAAATQAFQARPGRRYLHTVVARCAGGVPAPGRIQINWHDARSNFVSVSSKEFYCSDDWREYGLEVVAPRNAVTGLVYAASNSELPILIKSVSLR